MQRALVWIAAVASAVTAGCLDGRARPVGECEADLARTVVYRASDGMPAYVGQAYVIGTCVRCHGAEATGGAAGGLDLDVSLAAGTGDGRVASMRRLRQAQAEVHAQRELVYGDLVAGRMPPAGELRDPGYLDRHGAPLPPITDAAAHEHVRNWLACGSPLVEATTAAPMPCTDDGDCAATGVCDREGGFCVGVGDIARASCATTSPLSSWPWLYECVLSPTCAGAGCHGATSPPPLAGTIEGVRSTLLSPPLGACADPTGASRYVVPGDADESVLVHVLEGVDASGAPVCGAHAEMGRLLDDAVIAALRQWIDAGAAER